MAKRSCRADCASIICSCTWKAYCAASAVKAPARVAAPLAAASSPRTRAVPGVTSAREGGATDPGVVPGEARTELGGAPTENGESVPTAASARAPTAHLGQSSSRGTERVGEELFSSAARRSASR
eukprot:3853799-Pyramimonas_sp.AAC.1